MVTKPIVPLTSNVPCYESSFRWKYNVMQECSARASSMRERRTVHERTSLEQ